MALGADWQQIQSRPNIDDDEHGRAIDDTKYKVVRKTWILVLFSGPSFGPEEKLLAQGKAMLIPLVEVNQAISAWSI